MKRGWPSRIHDIEFDSNYNFYPLLFDNTEGLVNIEQKK